MRGVKTLQNYYKFPITVTVHPWREGHSISISTCGVWEGKNRDLSLQERVSHTYTLRLSYNRIYILCVYIYIYIYKQSFLLQSYSQNFQ